MKRQSRALRRLRKQVGELRADIRRLEDGIRSRSRRGFIGQLLTAIGVGWLFRPRSPQQGHPVHIRGGSRHAVRAGGEPVVHHAGDADGVTFSFDTSPRHGKSSRRAERV